MKNVEEMYPLSPMQRGMLFHSLLEDGAYVTQTDLELEGNLDFPRFRAAWRRILKRHAVLRTGFFNEGLDEPLQVVRLKVRAPLVHEDWREFSATEREQRFAAFRREDFQKGFDLRKPPLMRLALFRVDARRHRCLWTSHHILMDGWCLNILFREFLLIYEALGRGETPELPETRPYRDYIAWLQKQDLEVSEAFWRRTLAGFEEPNTLPGRRWEPASDGTEESENAQRFGTRWRTLSPSKISFLKTLGRRHGLTQNTVAQYTWALLLSRYNQCRDVIFGSVVSGRPPKLRGVEETVGLFINTLPVRVQINPEDAVLGQLKRLQSQQLEARQHEFTPLTDMQRWSDVPSGQSLFESLFAFENYPEIEKEGQGGRAASLRVISSENDSKTNYPISVTIVSDEEFRVSFEFFTSHFEALTVQRLLEQWICLLEGLLEAPEVPVSSLSMLTPAARHQLTREWNDSEVAYPQESGLAQLFEGEVERQPDSIVMVAGDLHLSRAELNLRSHRLASSLIAFQGGDADGCRGARMGLLLERSPEFVIAMLAVLKVGASYVPLATDYPLDRLRLMAEDAGLAALLAEEHLVSGLADLGLPTLALDADGEERAQQPELPVLPRAGGSDLAYVMYTSGSTGVPKGIGIPQRAVTRLVRGANYFQCDSGTTNLLLAPVSFDASTFETWMPLLNSGRLVFTTPGAMELDGLSRAIRDHRVTALWLTTGLFHLMVDERLQDLARVQDLLVGGDVLSPERARQVAELPDGPRAVNFYGPTENTTFTTFFPFPAPSQFGAKVSIGRPISNSSVFVGDDALEQVPIACPGELLTGGEGLGWGYLGRPAQTAELFVPNPFSQLPGGRLYKTGDRVLRGPEGNLEFIGRLDKQVKIRGFRIEPGEVEAAILRQKGVDEAVVLVRGEGGEKRLLAYVVSVAADFSIETLRRDLAGHLPEFMMPAQFVVLDAFPLTANGKIDQRALPIPDLGEVQDRRVAPRTPLEEVLANLWSEVLGVDEVGALDSFFDLGGHSLSAIQLVSRIREACGVDLPLRDLFENPTVAELGRTVEAARRAGMGIEVPALRRASRDGDLPLSFAQQRLWFIDQLEPGLALYNMPFPLRLEGTLHESALEYALGEVVRRHEVLRTTFETVGGRPFQRIAVPGSFSLPRIDLTFLPREKREQETWRLVTEDAERPFDLGKGPVLRASLVQLGVGDAVILFNLHHIAGDGWSFDVLTQEIGTFYGARQQGKRVDAPELPIQYADFSLWQRDWLVGDVLEGELAHWRDRLEDAPSVLGLPTDRPRPSSPTFRGGNRALDLPPALGLALKEVARKQGATLFMVLLAGFQALLSRYSGEEQLTVGTPVAGRNHLQLEPLIGFFVNTLVLRGDLSGSPGFAEVLRRVRRTVLEAQGHQDVPFERIVEELVPERNLGHAPLFQVMFAVQNMAEDPPDLGEVKMSLLLSEGTTAKFDLSMACSELAEGGISLEVEYALDLFDGSTMERLLRHYGTLLTAAMAETSRPMVELPLLSPAEHHQALREWNDTREDLSHRTIPELFASQAVAQPGAATISYGAEKLSRGELDERAESLALSLRGLGIGPEDRVALLFNRSLWRVVATLAVWKARAAVVPLDPSWPEARLEFVLADCSPKTVLFAGDLPRDFDMAGVRPLDVSAPGQEVSQRTEDMPVTPPVRRDLAYLIYTSGTTGRPKAVMVEHAQLSNTIQGAAQRFGFEPADVMLQVSSYAFDIALFEVWAPLISGAEVLLAEEDELLDMGRLVERLRAATFFHTVPSLLSQLLSEVEDSGRAGELRELRRIFVGGDSVPPALLRRVKRLLPECRLDVLYGPTEGTILATGHAVSQAAVDGHPIGRPLPNVELRVMDQRGRPVPIQVTGELYLGGAGVSRGYWGRTARTASSFVGLPTGRFYRTGDLARYRADGVVEFLGRADHQLKIRGFRIEAGEVEAALLAHESIVAAVVVAREEQEERSLVAYVVVQDGVEAPSAEACRAHLLARLPAYMVPALFVTLDALPLSSTGKVDRAALPVPGAVVQDFLAPRNENEAIVAGVWAEVLGLEEVGAEAHFFTSGGHSLLATQVVSRLREAFGVDISLREFFENPTVADLARKVEAAHRAGSRSVIPPLQPAPRDGDLPLSFAQQRLWFIDQLQPGLALYNMPFPLRLEGPLQGAALEHALTEVIRRHEVLRTTFEMVDGHPCQRIAPPVDFALPRIDLRGLPPEQRRHEMKSLIEEDAARPFDLNRGPILRAALVLLGEEDTLLLFNLHHIAGDGWSIEVLIQEISTLYKAAQLGGSANMSPLEVQYADFALWQRGWLVGNVLAGELAHWREILADIPPLELPTDRPRPSTPSLRGAARVWQLAPSLGRALHALAQRQGATLFMVLLTGFEALLARYCGAEKLSVGTPVAGRNHLELEPLIGFFVNTLVLRLDLSGSPGFTELLGRASQTVLEAQDHQEVPFEKLVEEVAPDRDLGRSPLFQVMFSVENLAVDAPDLGEVKLSLLSGEGGLAKFDLSVVGTEQEDGGISLDAEYAAELFDGTTVTRLLRHWGTLLEAALGALDTPVAELPLLSSAELQQVAVEWNDSAAESPLERGLWDLFAEQATMRHAAVAVVSAFHHVSLGTLAEQAHRVAAALARSGVTSGHRVGLYAERSVEMVLGILGILKAGAAYVALDLECPAERLRLMMEDAGLEVVLTSADLASSLPAVASPLVFNSILSQPSTLPGWGWGMEQASASGGDHLAYVSYTSGSTGRPKGVAVPQRAVVRLVRGANFAELEAGQTFLQLAPVAFDASTLEFWGPLLNGGRLVVMAPGVISLEALGVMLRRERVTVAWLTAGLFHLMVDERVEDLSLLTQLLAGGDVISPERVRKVLELPNGPRLINGYGPTENTTFTTCHGMRTPPPGVGSIPIGRPVSNSRVWILDRCSRPVPTGVFGELMTSGAGLARGYLGEPAGTAARFIPHPLSRVAGERLYRTGDLARYRADGEIEFAGRLDQQVKLRGFRIEPGEIESALLARPEVAAAAVMVREDGGTALLVAYVVGRQGEAPDAEALRSALVEELPPYMVPARFVFLEALPLTANKKLDRNALPMPDEGASIASDHAPRTESEETLAALWLQVLGVESVGTGDNFFDLGGHSLLATQVMSRVRRVFGVDVPLRELFENPTVASLAKVVDSTRRKASGLSIPPLGPRSREGGIPLSFAQQRLWFIDQFEPGLALYNMPFPLRLEGPLDEAALEYALAAVVRRHEVLRTTFQTVEGRPYQRVAPRSDFSLPRIDLTALSEEEREREVWRLVAADAGRSFDLSAGPVLRTSLVRLGREDAVILFNLHHIAGDGWSIEVLTQEISALYEAAQRGRAAELPELPIQYSDFAIWQRSWLAGEVLEGELAHWRDLLGTAPQVLGLPSDRPRPTTPTFRGATRAWQLTPAVGNALKQAARQQSATLFMVLLTGFKALLSRYSGEEELAVGTPVAGRNHLELEGLIGFFVNTLVLKADFSGSPSFVEALERVRKTVLEAQDHQEVPFEKLVEELAEERDFGHAPLFQVMFALQNLAEDPPQLGAVKMSLLSGEGSLAKFDLSVAGSETKEGGISLEVEFARDLFDGTTAERLLRHYGGLLEAALAAPECPLVALSFLSSAERHQVQAEWNDCAVASPTERGLWSLFSEQARLRRDAVALVAGAQHMSFETLAARGHRLARVLAHGGTSNGHRVGLYVERSVEMVIAILGILKAGGAYVALDPEYPAERLRLMTEDAELACIVTTAGLEPSLPTTAVPSLLLESVLSPGGNSVGLGGRVEQGAAGGGDHLAYVSYTSGSTGRPKGVAVPQRAVVRLVRGANFAELEGRQTYLQLAPVAFDASTLELWGPLLNGGRLVLMPAGAPSLELLGTVLRRERISVLWLTAGLFHLMVDEHLGALEGVSQLLAGGDVLSPEHVRQVLALPGGPKLINGYGPTENTTFTSCHPIATPLESGASVPIGRPVSNSQVWLVDGHLKPVPMGVFGELLTSGEGLAQGYWGNPAATAEHFLPHPFGQTPGERVYCTGDLARSTRDGLLEFAGRLDQQVKIRGFRIEPGEVESTLLAQPGVGAAVVTVEGEGSGRRLVAYMVGSGEPLESESLRVALTETLPPYMVPAAFVFLEALPLTANGKLNRAALPSPETGQPTESYTAPRTEGEGVMAGVWCEVLGLEQVGVEDNFFELGGHSLLATQVMSRVRGAFGAELPLRAIFDHPTVASLVRAVEKACREESGFVVPSLKPVVHSGAIPLSFAQQRLWFIDQLEPGSALYNMPFPVRLEGPLRPEVVRYALSEVIRRHHVLRTRFVATEGIPRQIVEPFEAVALPEIDLTGLAAQVREHEVLRLLAEDQERPFDLAKGPVVRASLVHLKEEEAVLLFNLHHIAGDGWSMEVLTQEISALYTAGQRGKAADLTPLPVQYADFSSWQRGWLQGEVLEKEIAHWRQRLQGAPSLLELPTDRPRPALPTYRGDAREKTLSPEVSRKVKDLARRQGATLFMVALAGLQWVLARTSGQDDISVGTPVAGRGRLELEPLIGFFVNTLVFRVRLVGVTTFSELVHQVRGVALEGQNHQDLPFEKLVEELEPERELNHSPLFQVLFTVENLPQAPPPLGEVKMSPMVGDGAGMAKFDLNSVVTESAAGELSLTMGYAVDLFDGSTIERMLGRLATLFEHVAEDPEQSLAEIPLLSAAERHQLGVEWNDAQAAYPAEHSLPQLFAEQRTKRSETVAVSLEGQQLSYGELARRSRQAASALTACRVSVDTPVGLFMERSVEMVVGTLGILEAGGAYVPLDPEYPRERLRMMVEDAGLETVVTTVALAPRLPQTTAEVLELDALGAEDLDGVGQELRIAPPRRGGGDRLAYIMYTSGSTGRPKGVAVPHRGVVRLVKGAKFAALGPEEVFLQLAPISFDLSTLELWGPLLNGGRVVLMPPGVPSLEQLGATLWRQRISTLWLTAGLFHLMVDERAEDLQALRQLLAGGDVLSPERVRQVLQLPRAPRMIDGYGPTENTTFTSCHGMSSQAEVGPSVSIGRPVSNSAVWIVDRSLRQVPQGVFGELVTSGAGLARGYLGRPALTAERFVPHAMASIPGDRLYRTGDMARHLPDGRLEFSGRMDQQVKLRGFRIEPGEVEATLLQQAEVSAAFVMVRGDVGERNLVAYLVGSGEGVPDSEALRAALKEQLPPYMIPAAFVPLEALPLSPNGKVDRKALPAPGLSKEEAYVAPRSQGEEVMAGIWAEVLGVERVGVEENFFELGGHSLVATQVISRVQRALGVELSLRMLFEHPTVSSFARAVEAMRGEASGRKVPPLRKASREEDLPLSFAQQRLWFIDRLEPGTPLYNMPFPVRLEGPLQPAILEFSLQEILHRHEMLRTTFVAHGGNPAQRVSPGYDFRLPLVDLQGVPKPLRESVALRWVAEDGGRPFDLAEGPLLRATLLLLSPEEAILMFNLHHIAGDGWSIDVLVQEISEIYLATGKGVRPRLAELPVQYADFALWQRSWLRGEVLEAEISFWRERLRGKPPQLELPTDRPRPAMPSFRGASAAYAMSPRAGDGLRTLARKQGATLFMVTLAGLQWTLARLSGQEDISVGTPAAGRNRVELEGLIGFFINTLVLRVDLAGARNFADVLGQVRRRVLEAQDHQEIPFEKLVEELEPERTLGQSPLFQVMFTLQNLAQEAPDLGEVKVRPLEGGGSSAKFDLSVSASETPDGGVELGMEYAVDLFDGTTIERWLRHLSTVLTAVVRGPEQSLDEIPLLSEVETHQLQVEWNDVAVAQSQENTIPELFLDQVRTRGDAVALVSADLQLSYGELARRAKQLAGALLARGAEPDALVGVYADRSVEMVVANLGILLAGQAYLPLDPTYPAERLRWLIEDANLRTIVSHQGVTATLPVQIQSDVSLLPLESLQGSETTAQPVRTHCDQAAYVMYTSGSTGRPKGVVVTQKGVTRLVRGASYADLGPREVFLHLAPVSFDAATFEIWGPLLNGGRLVLLPAGLPVLEEVGAHLARFRVSTVLLTTGLFHLMADERVEDLTVLRQLITGGDVLSPERARKVLESPEAPRLINAYGPTENAVITTSHGMDRPREVGSPAPIGRPISNSEVWITDRRLRAVPRGTFGELLTSGKGLARGYLGRPALTAERFVPHPCARKPGGRVYRTGDLARYGAAGQIEFAGRFDQQVKVRGFRIEPGEIEAAILRQVGISAAFVMVHEDTGKERLVAYVVGQEGTEPEPQVLQKALGEELPPHLIPSLFIPLDSLPLTANGKLDREALPAPTLASESGRTTAPRDQVEQQLVEVWQDLLGSEKVGIHDNFFEVGGHSLLVVQMLSRVHKVLGKELPVAAVFKAPTIAGLASILRGDRKKDLYNSLVPFHTEGTGAPLFFVHPGGGLVFFYRELVEQISQGRPAYGLQSQGIEGGVAPIDTIEGMASHYIEEIRGVQAEGPYHLLGWSMGGVIAFEIARQLQDAGESVALLGFIDTRMPVASDRLELGDEGTMLESFAQDFGLPMDFQITMEEFKSLTLRERIETMLTRAQQEGTFPPELTVSRVQRYFQVFKMNGRALAKYVPRDYPGKILLFKATEPFARTPPHPEERWLSRLQFQAESVGHWLKIKFWERLFNPTLGWGKIRGCEVETYRIPGTHLSILQEPQVETLAEKLRVALDKLGGVE